MPSAIASNILGLSESTQAIHRFDAKSQTSSPRMSTSLLDRTNTINSKSTRSTVMTRADSTAWLPEMHSTPPMPTFQKPDMATPPTPVRSDQGQENATPTRQHGTRRPVHIPGEGNGSATRATFPRPRAVYSTISPDDRVSETSPLPHNWTAQHDRAICILDARNYSLTGIVAKVRRTFPNLRGTLTPAMIDKRLRQLDQDVSIDYWAVGLAKASHGKKAEETFNSPARLGLASSRLDGSATSMAEGASDLSALRTNRHRGPLNDHL